MFLMRENGSATTRQASYLSKEAKYADESGNTEAPRSQYKQNSVEKVGAIS
jgi:hypothetical protein